MNASPPLEVSFVLATHNRCAVAAATLRRLNECGLPRHDYEIIVVDNASDDGTADTLAGLCDTLLWLRRNWGSCAKSFGADRAVGRFIVFLDDDSHPRPGSLDRMLERFRADPKLGAAGFTVHLPSGALEGGALPEVFLGCGVGLRASALRAVGGLDRTFFMQAEEYDLSFRLVNAGWRVKMFDDLHVDHLKTEHARRTTRTTYYDVRNNLRLAARYLPPTHLAVYRDDWRQRYAWLARRQGHDRAFRRGVAAGRLCAAVERWGYRRQRLSPGALEHFFRWDYVADRFAELAADGVGSVVLADLGKNVFAYRRGAADAGIEVLAVGDDRFAEPGRCYRGLPVVPLDDALDHRADAVVVGNSSAVHGTSTLNRVASKTSLPVHHWFGPTAVEGPSVDGSRRRGRAASASIHAVPA